MAGTIGGGAIAIPDEEVLSSNVLVLKVMDSIPSGTSSGIYAGIDVAWDEMTGSTIAMNGAHMIYDAPCHQEMTAEPEGLINVASFPAAADPLDSEWARVGSANASSQVTAGLYVRSNSDAKAGACTPSRVDGLSYRVVDRGDL